MHRVVHFEINADDPVRAVRFYQQVFGWKVEKWGGPTDYWLLQTGPEGDPGINGAIMRRGDSSAGVWNGIQVPSVDEYLAKIEAAGGTTVMPKTEIPGMGWVAYGKDTEGNIFSIVQWVQPAQ